MASTSISSIKKSFKYDVFISFRGEDTRKNFVDHLYHALQQKGVETYKDDKKITKGKSINDGLIQAIEDSKFYIIVFSKNYASSSWCLEELVKIMECQKMSEHTAYPVFLDVEPSEVRTQNGVVEVAFAKHVNDKSAGIWREALKKAADLAGWELKNIFYGHEAKLVQKIVEEISLELRFINSGADENLIGMKARINDVVSTFELGVDDVRMIGIKGMGGVGKTTLARAVYDYISFQFEGCSFVENVREKSTPSMSGLNLLQKQILSDVFLDQGISVSGVLEGKSMLKKKMCGKKVIIVLDDVDKIEQLVALAGDRSWFKRGSRIIITTRDAQVLIAHKVNMIHDVYLLTDQEAMCLFSRHAFGREIPIEGYKELSKQAVCYAAGLPLTIRVLGSFFCGKDDLDWKDALERLKTIPLNETMKVLELSYIDLEEDYKEIFLDVACLLKGWRKDSAIKALESCGFHARNGLRVLEQRSLITTSLGVVRMHDHIEEMGMNIVRRLNPNEPKRHSRLWINKEIIDIMVNDSGTRATKCIRLNASGISFEILLKGLANMKELRFLQVHSAYVSEDDVSNWSFDEVDLYLPNALRFLTWTGYPFSSLPKTFQAKDLVGLEMKYSIIVQLWKDGEEKACLKLRFLKFTYSKLRTLDLSVAPNLETLILENCYNLVEVHFQVTPKLEELCINGCKRLKKLHMPAESPKLRSLDLNISKLRNLHLGITPKLETLRVKKCTDMVKLHMPAQCPKLVDLELSYLKLTSLHLGITPNLKTLTLNNLTNLVELQIRPECPKLVNLDLNIVALRTLHLVIAPNLEILSLRNCSDMVELHMPAQCPKLADLNLSYLKLTSLHLGITPNLRTLTLNNLTDLVELQILAECPKLLKLDLNIVTFRTLDLGMTPNLNWLNLKNCNDLVEMNAPIGCLKELVHLDFSGCRRFKSFVFSKKSADVIAGSLSELYLIAESIGTCPLHSDNDLPKLRFTCFYESSVSPNGNLEKLISLGLCTCTNLESFSRIISGLRCLRKLKLEGCITEAPKDLDQIECLEELLFWSTSIKHLPYNVCMLKHLKFLELKSCWLIEKLPEDLVQLECLEELYLTECILLRDIPESICGMKRLKYFHLPYCILVEKLPEEFGRLECLKEVNIEGTGISRLPLSIFRLKGLRILGTRWRLESYGFKSVIQHSRCMSFCYV